MAYGTLTLQDLLAVTDTSVVEFGEDRLWEAFDVLFAAHREREQEILAQFVDVTRDRLRRYGAGETIDLDALDELGSPDVQKVAPAGTTVGFPLRRYGVARQWSRDWFLRHTVRELTVQVQAAIDADTRRIDAEIRRAIFVPTNYTFVDRLVDQVELPVKALVNADGAAIPLGPHGATFDGATHTHYLARAGGSLVQSDVTGLITTVVEHYEAGPVLLYINKAQEAAVRAFADFHEYTDARLIQPSDQVNTRRFVDLFDTSNRAIGILAEAEVWVKPWIPANYMFVYISSAPSPLAMRIPDLGETGLHLAYDNELYPLRAQMVAHDFGMGVWNRTNGAVLYAGNTTYTAPTITI